MIDNNFNNKDIGFDNKLIINDTNKSNENEKLEEKVKVQIEKINFNQTKGKRPVSLGIEKKEDETEIFNEYKLGTLRKERAKSSKPKNRETDIEIRLKKTSRNLKKRTKLLEKEFIEKSLENADTKKIRKKIRDLVREKLKTSERQQNTQDLIDTNTTLFAIKKREIILLPENFDAFEKDLNDLVKLKILLNNKEFLERRLGNQISQGVKTKKSQKRLEKLTSEKGIIELTNHYREKFKNTKNGEFLRSKISSIQEIERSDIEEYLRPLFAQYMQELIAHYEQRLRKKQEKSSIKEVSKDENTLNETNQKIENNTEI